jgi:hypothetical protein
VCGALGSWSQAIDEQVKAFKAAFQRAGSADEKKSAIVALLDSSGDRTRQLAYEIGSIDTTAVPGAFPAQMSMTDALNANAIAFGASVSKVQALDTSDETWMKSALLEIFVDMRVSRSNAPVPLGNFGDQS